jgi:hypothetical protein
MECRQLNFSKYFTIRKQSVKVPLSELRKNSQFWVELPGLGGLFFQNINKYGGDQMERLLRILN